jgi:hypothetical protein
MTLSARSSVSGVMSGKHFAKIDRWSCIISDIGMGHSVDAKSEAQEAKRLLQLALSTDENDPDTLALGGHNSLGWRFRDRNRDGRSFDCAKSKFCFCVEASQLVRALSQKSVSNQGTHVVYDRHLMNMTGACDES